MRVLELRTSAIAVPVTLVVKEDLGLAFDCPQCGDKVAEMIRPGMVRVDLFCFKCQIGLARVVQVHPQPGALDEYPGPTVEEGMEFAKSR